MIGLRYSPSLPFLSILETFVSLKARFSPIWDGFFMIFDDFLHDVLNSCVQIQPSIFEQIRINIFEHFPKTSNHQPHNSTNHFSKILARRYARKRLNNEKDAPDRRLQTGIFKQRAPDRELQTDNSRQTSPNSELQADNSRQTSPDRELQTDSCRQTTPDREHTWNMNFRMAPWSAKNLSDALYPLYVSITMGTDFRKFGLGFIKSCFEDICFHLWSTIFWFYIVCPRKYICFLFVEVRNYLLNARYSIFSFGKRDFLKSLPTVTSHMGLWVWNSKMLSF